MLCGALARLPQTLGCLLGFYSTIGGQASGLQNWTKLWHDMHPFPSRVELSQHATLESVSAAAVKSDLKLPSPYTRGKLSYNRLMD